MSLVFEWDDEKAQQNLKKHQVSFEEALTVFGDPFSLTIADPLHSTDEDRFIIIGTSKEQRILIVVHSERNDNIRIISARLATKRERNQYEEGDKS